MIRLLQWWSHCSVGCIRLSCDPCRLPTQFGHSLQDHWSVQEIHDSKDNPPSFLIFDDKIDMG